NTNDLFVGKTLLHGDVLMWLMKTLLTSGCTNQRGAGHAGKVQTAHHQMVAGLDIGVTHAIYDGQFCKPV
ncbi:hypothetical protein ACXHZJ_23580, partial [Klebsiella pneumoniae]